MAVIAAGQSPRGPDVLACLQPSRTASDETWASVARVCSLRIGETSMLSEAEIAATPIRKHTFQSGATTPLAMSDRTAV
jgi:hypothetical protein